MTESPVLTRASTTPTRTAPPAAYVAAGGLVVEGVIALVHTTGDRDWDALSQILNAAYAIAAIALVLVLPSVGSWLRVERAGRIGVVVAQIGLTAMAVESVVSGINDGNTLGGLFFGGLLLALAGLLVLGIAALVAGQVRWAALLPFLAMIIAIAGGEHGGSIVAGIVWTVLGVTMSRADG
jgi:hypothetical protein